jgi:hypothetical protein
MKGGIYVYRQIIVDGYRNGWREEYNDKWIVDRHAVKWMEGRDTQTDAFGNIRLIYQ